MVPHFPPVPRPLIRHHRQRMEKGDIGDNELIVLKTSLLIPLDINNEIYDSLECNTAAVSGVFSLSKYYMFIELTVALVLIALSIQWFFTNTTNLPRVGPPTFLGYIWTALRFTYDRTLIDQARQSFSGRPFVMPTLGGSFIVVGPEMVEFMQHHNDTVVCLSISSPGTYQPLDL
jgi:hypothetical protein